ncbi:SdrD B-like domain-containing protein [Coleofasciculus sp. FACHB-SPT9]|uniref:beta strand repeat-containing protein n=1 Tax=Cyanophyceae TaxID=3028117 RepID=UPI001686F9C2|nr:SdrD B-like domain-containing protein [Coleofasciculus sp. FACHB-SPT9]MBD1889535.1 carboxypeptidase regulatory-like domain-containing protein [Coleofasciculus sp. FACHB-SPT9]
MQLRFRQPLQLSSNSYCPLQNFKLWLVGGTATIAALIGNPSVTSAQTTFPSVPGLNFQTSGRQRCANVGDWYTTNGLTPCSPTSATPTTSTDKIHRISVSITPAMIAAGGGSVTITVEDAESNGALDEVNDADIGTLICPPTGATTCDPTRFQLRDATGNLLQSQVIGTNTGTNAANNTSVVFTVNQPDTYQVTSETGAEPIFGNNATNLNDDDNTFKVIVSQSGGLVGNFQGTVQQNTEDNLTIPFYFLLGPTSNGTSNLFLRNFDLDNGGTVTYIRPNGSSIQGTGSGNAVWNGGLNNLNNGGDNLTATNTKLATGGDAGIWRLRINNFTPDNQILIESNADGSRLPLFDQLPTTAGNFTITPSDTLSTTLLTPIDHPFTVKNNFFTNDIINLTATGTNANYTVQLLDASGKALPDTDSNGVPDTGILTPGQTGNFILRVTPNAGATTADTTQINAVSFMDNKVDPANNTTQFVNKTTTITPSSTGSIGDLVFNDLNANGTQDSGEPGLANVTITLRDANGNVIATTTTDANGNYSFPNLPAGGYTVTATNPAGFNITTGSNQVPVNLAAGQTVNNVDFGYSQPSGGTIGDRVFNDLDSDGTQDPNEPGMSGVTVTLKDANGNVIATATTDANGNYSFTNLPAGSYTVDATDPAGFTLTTGNDPFSVNLAAGQTVNNVDFGYRQPGGKIGDLVFNDTNGNGTQDPGEPGLAGVTVTLTGPSGTLTTTTDANGNYNFSNLPAGSYSITVTDPTGFTLTTSNEPFNVNLAQGQTISNVDFGFRQTGSIGDLVFNDTNGNGIQDPGEPGLANITVTLKNANGTAIATTTTNANGNYTFTNLPAGSYTVEATDPTGFTLTTNNDPFSVNLGAGQTVNNVDFGYRQTNASIGNSVFNDLNNNGIQDPGEPGIGGVTVTLTGPGGTTVTTTTDPNGNYIFSNLPAGNYTVAVNNPPPGFNPTATPAAINLETGQNVTNADFGFRQPQGTIGDRVFNDTNGNGIQDAGEPGISGVTVTLTGPNGTVTTTTDANGNYNFSNLPAGNYTVAVNTPPTGFTATATPSAITLATGQNVDNADFGFRQPNNSIGTLVYNDLNGNGIQDAGEKGISGVTVTLKDANGNVIATTTTDANGNYIFNNLPNGTYIVDVTDPTGFKLTTNNDLLSVTISPNNPNFSNANFGFLAGGTIGDRVFNDTNGNGIQDEGEPGISGVVVTLKNANGAVIATTTTDANGNYNFSGLPLGNYIVEVADPAGFTLTTNNDSSPVSLTAAAPIVNNVDFGFRQANGSIGDLVFNDLDGNGTKDPDEPGISGVTVTLRDANGNIIATTTTDANGNYSFTNLPVGNYIIDVTDPAGFTLTTSNDSVPVTFTPGKAVTNIDFGFRKPGASFGNRVFNDTNGNGTQDAGETGIGGVTLTLKDANGNIIATTITDANGNYVFSGLAAGTYTVEVSNPPGLTLTTNNASFRVTVTANQTVTNADFGFRQATLGAGNLRLVKRITNATRNGVPISGINFSSFVNDPNDQNDDVPGFAQLSPVGVVKVPSENALTSGDEVEYTIYFLSDGGSPVNNVRFCDAIPSGTTFISNNFGSGSGISLNRAGTVTNQTNASDTDAGVFLSPLAPLSTGNACSNQTNPDGSVVVNLGDVSNVAGSNFGFVRFRVKIN